MWLNGNIGKILTGYTCIKIDRMIPILSIIGRIKTTNIYELWPKITCFDDPDTSLVHYIYKQHILSFFKISLHLSEPSLHHGIYLYFSVLWVVSSWWSYAVSWTAFRNMHILFHVYNFKKCRFLQLIHSATINIVLDKIYN